MARMPPLTRADVGPAVVLAAYALVEALLIAAPSVWVAGVPLAMLGLVWRRVAPLTTIAAVLAMVSVLGALSGPHGAVLPLPLAILCGYTAGREVASAPRTAFGAAGVIAFMMVALTGGAIRAENTQVEDLVALLVVVGGAAAAGRAMRLRQRENARLRSEAAELAAEQKLVARAAVAEERARVARELHDVVAHSISLIAVQTGAAQELMGRDDVRARDALQSVQDTAREALGEMRRLLGVLRAHDDAPGLEPQPGLAAIGDLVDHARSRGLPVELREEGVRGPVPAGVELSAFRIVQEALTNVRKHAGPVPTTVLVRYAPDEVILEVSNAARADASGGDRSHPGYGVTGMRERTRIYGGALAAGPRDGRYVVEARIPLEGAVE